MKELKTKICLKCKKEKDIEEFRKYFHKRQNKYYYRSYCKSCEYEYNLEYRKEHLEASRRSSSKWRKNNPEKNRESQRKSDRKRYKKNPEKRLEINRKWRKNNPEKVRKYNRERENLKRETDPLHRLNGSISSQIYQSLKQDKSGRHWEDLVGYTLDDLKNKLESLFEEGMCWENYGTWHIDHCIPLSWFDEEHIMDAWSLWNLQPLWGKENISKHNKYKSTIRISCKQYSH
jgi:hypothetical protein